MNSKQQIVLNKVEYLFKIVYIVGFLIVLALLSETGKNYIISSFMVFMLIYLFCGLCIPKAFSNLVKVRFQKQQLKNAGNVFKSTLLYLLLLEGVVMLIAYIFVEKASAFLHVEKALPYGIALFLPLLLLVPINEVFRSYYQCFNRMLTIIISRSLGILSTFLAGLCVYTPLKNYGQKVDALLKTECMQDMYASLTIPIALLIAQVIVCIYLLWMYLVYKPYIKKQIGRDLTKSKESTFSLLVELLKEHFFVNLHKISIYLLVLVAFICCSFYNRRMLGMEEMNTSFGILAVVLIVTVLMPYFFTKAFSLKDLYRYRKMLKNEDVRGIKSYIWGRTHKFFIVSVAVTIFFIVLSERVIFILIGAVSKQYILHMQILSVSFVLVTLYRLYHMFLSNLGKHKALLIMNYTSLALSTVVTIGLYNVPSIAGYGISIGLVCYFLIAFILEFIVLEKEFGFHRNFISLFVLPALSASIMGIILLLINKVIPLSEERVTQVFIILLLFVVCSFVYRILLLVLHGIDEDELSDNFLGNTLYKLGKILHIY